MKSSFMFEKGRHEYWLTQDSDDNDCKKCTSLKMY